MITPGIVAYSFGGGVAVGGPPPCAATCVFQVHEASGNQFAVIGEPLPFWAPEAATDQLQAWAASINGSGAAGVYAFTYDPATQRMTAHTINGVAFRPVPFENAALWTGFTQTMSGTATSWTGHSAPLAVTPLAGVTVEPAEDAARVELHTYRHQRAVSTVWGNHQLHQITLIGSTRYPMNMPAFALSGRVRVYQGHGNIADYSPTNPGGVVDGFVVTTTDATQDGDMGEFVTCKLLLAVPR